MKKAFALLIALVMCFALFACTPDSGSGDGSGSGSGNGDSTNSTIPSVDSETPIVDVELN